MDFVRRFSGFLNENNEAYYDKLVFKMIQLLAYKAMHTSEAYNFSDPDINSKV